MAKYKEIVRALYSYISEGKLPEPLLEEIRSLEEELSERTGSDLEDRIYLEALNILRTLRQELENSLEMDDSSKKAFYGIPIRQVTERENKALEVTRIEHEEEGTVKQRYEPLKGDIEGTLVIFKTPIPKFVGVDMKVYGPFSQGDVALIPYENARALITKGVAEEVNE